MTAAAIVDRDRSCRSRHAQSKCGEHGLQERHRDGSTETVSQPLRDAHLRTQSVGCRRDCERNRRIAGNRSDHKCRKGSTEDPIHASGARPFANRQRRSGIRQLHIDRYYRVQLARHLEVNGRCVDAWGQRLRSRRGNERQGNIRA